MEDTRVVVDDKAEESDGKTASGRRTIALDPLTVSYLRRHLAMWQPPEPPAEEDEEA